MYSSIYTLQSSTQRLPIQALFGFTLKATKSYSVPSPQSSCVCWFLVLWPWVASLDQPEVGPSSLKCPRLEEHITMDVEEDTISLGDEEDRPFVYEDSLIASLTMLMR